MLRVAQNKDEIIIRELPVANWIGFSGFTIFLFVLFLISLSLNKDISDQLWLTFIGVGALIFLSFSLLNQIMTIKINKPGQTVSVRKQSLLTYSFKVYSFNEIDNPIYVEAKAGGRGGKIYQLIMPLKTGEKIELSTSEGSKKSQYFDAAHLMNPYIFDDSSKQIAAASEAVGNDLERV